MAICETFLSSSSPMAMFEVPMMKSVSRSRKLNARGGQVICIRKDWSFSVIENLSIWEEGLCEMLSVETLFDSFIFGSVYRPPSSNPKIFFEVFESGLLNSASKKKQLLYQGTLILTC